MKTNPPKARRKTAENFGGNQKREFLVEFLGKESQAGSVPQAPLSPLTSLDKTDGMKDSGQSKQHNSRGLRLGIRNS